MASEEGARVAEDAAVRHAVEALTAIQSHGATNDNELSMIWTARVALNPDALALCPLSLVDVVRDRFTDLDDRYAKGRTPPREEVRDEAIAEIAYYIDKYCTGGGEFDFEAARLALATLERNGWTHPAFSEGS